MTSVAKGRESEPDTRASKKGWILNDMQVLGLVVLQGVFLEVIRSQSSIPSFGSGRATRGRLLRHVLICVSTVVSSSNVILTLPMTWRRCDLKLFTAAFHSPPKCGECSGMKRHCIFWTVLNLEIWSCVF